MTAELAPFLPRPTVERDGDRYRLDDDRPDSIGKVRPWYGVAPNLVRAYAWIMSLGADGLREVAETAVLNNNYLHGEGARDPRRVGAVRGRAVAGSSRSATAGSSWPGRPASPRTTSGRRVADFGTHYWTSHHPFVVPEPMTLEPTESYSRADLDEYAAILRPGRRRGVRGPGAWSARAPHASTIHRIDQAALDDPAPGRSPGAPTGASTPGRTRTRRHDPRPNRMTTSTRPGPRPRWIVGEWQRRTAGGRAAGGPGSMAKIGYAAMLEQFHPTDLLEWCPAAEEAGFSAGFMVSEHIQPWTPQQGQAAFAWAFMGALGQRTSLRFGTAVTCPGFRNHPAVIAHAAATLGAMYPGRFWLGLGAGEALNEHVIGGQWPEIGVRSAMLFEAIEVINRLFGGEVVRHRGEHFRLESLRLYTRPETPVPVYVATAGPINAKKTGRLADGMITVGAADEKIGMLWGKFDEGAREAGKDPAGMPKLLQVHVSWARTEQEALDNAMREWPNGGMPFPKQDIRNPEDFAAMAKLVRPEDFRNRVLISSDLAVHAASLQHYVDMGFDEIHVHNVGRNQAEFITAFGAEVLPALRLG